jgi:hypothetical protein
MAVLYWMVRALLAIDIFQVLELHQTECRDDNLRHQAPSDGGSDPAIIQANSQVMSFQVRY